MKQELKKLTDEQEEKLNKLGAKQPKNIKKQGQEHYIQEDSAQEKNKLEKYRNEIKKYL